MDEELEGLYGDPEEAFTDLEAEIIKLLGMSVGTAYNSLDAWALVVRATSNDGEGDHAYGGVFTPPGQDRFTMAGLRWLLDEGTGYRD